MLDLGNHCSSIHSYWDMWLCCDSDFLKSCHICGGKEQIIIVTVMHSNVKLEFLESFGIVLNSANLLESRGVCDCSSKVISLKILLTIAQKAIQLGIG